MPLAAVTPAIAEHLLRARRAESFVTAGRHAAAERLLRDVAAALARRQAFEPCARVQIDLGRVLLGRGRAADARRAFADARTAAISASAGAVALDASLWEVAALTDGGALDEAAAQAAACAASPSALPRHHAWASACLARVALWRGTVEELTSLLPPRTGHEDPLVDAWIEATAVRVLIAGGRLFEAGCRAMEARRRLHDHVGPLTKALIETARLRVVCETGDVDAAAACVSVVRAHARKARMPLVAVRAELVWQALLQRAGLPGETETMRRRLSHVARAAPPLLRRAIDRLAGGDRAGSAPRGRVVSMPDPPTDPMPELAGVSRALADLRRAVARAAAAPFAVLIEGESGVGKELVARAIHRLGPRAAHRFCDVNCAALPDELVEAELFGHARGAFTGAAGDRPGLFEDASGGTLFLDEVSELSSRAQAKLLRVLQQQEVRRLGESVSRAVDVRIVAAANRSMPLEVTEGRFRADLLYRLDVIHLRVAPLRERPDDVPVLAERFWRAAAARVGTRADLSETAVQALSRYPWPGNVRELQNVMAALAVAAPVSGRVPPSLLPARITADAALHPTLAAVRASCDRQAVVAALARAGGSRSEAARALGVTRQGLAKLMSRLDVHIGGRGQT